MTRYFYDGASRITKVGAGASGTVDPTEYVFANDTGLMTKVTYTAGMATSDAFYEYDRAAQLTTLTDWIDSLHYAYDAAGRMTRLTDYDDSTLDYTYDAAGNVITMNDYHGNSTVYTYTDTGRVSTITAPGSKTWTYTYNALQQPTSVSIPNGMTTVYGYDTRNRMTTIQHKDGASVELGFTYALDDNGNITRTTEHDGTYWDYGYDGRDRLTAADRTSSSGNVVAHYAYAYDDADNMLTKIEPFFDDFNDGDYTGWIVLNGSWSASSTALLKTDNGWGNVAVLSDDADNEIRFDYRFTDISGADMGQVIPRFLSGDDNLAILIAPGAIILYSTVSGTAATLDYQTFSTTQDQWYTLRIVCDGSDVTVWRSTEGELETEVLSTSSAAPTTTDAVLMGIVNDTMSNSPFELDNIRILADDLENTTTFTVNTANQVTAMTVPNGGGTISFGYDAWGRQTSKTRGSHSATYGYRYGSKLYSVASNFPGEGTVTYNYGGDQKRRSMTAGAVMTGYNWDIGWNVISEENSSGTLTRTYVHNPHQFGRATLAQVNGANPATGLYDYYVHDNLGSTRALYGQTKTLAASYAYTPYGDDYLSGNTSATTHRFTGHDWSPQSGLYFAPYRFYNPQIARWMSRDPLGMVDGPNVYEYVFCRPSIMVDLLGLAAQRPTEASCLAAFQACNKIAKDELLSTLNALSLGVSVGATVACLASRNPIVCLGALGVDIAAYYLWLRPAWNQFKKRKASCVDIYECCLRRAED